MGVEAKFRKEDVRSRLDLFLWRVQKRQIERLKLLGEMCVNHARSIPKEQGFEDQTGNLRSSIGYSVFFDGVAIHSSYEVVLGGDAGAKAGQRLAQAIGEQTEGVCLVVTAGMTYALYLESKGRDVLTSAEHLAEKELPKMLEKLIDNIRKAGE